MTEKLYKVLNENRKSMHGGKALWHPPVGKRPGKWMESIPNPEPCQRGYHLVTLDQLPRWLGPTIWIAEGRGAHVEQDDKSVWESARLISKCENWNERIMRRFATDCANHVLFLYERKYPNDSRPREAIKAARRYARNPNEKNLQSMKVASSASSSAAYAASSAAYSSAAYASSYAASSAAYAASSAAYASSAYAASAYAASAVSASSAAYASVERSWQSKRLSMYLSGRIGTKQ